MPQQEHIIHLQNGKLHTDTPPQHIREMVEKALTHSGDGGVVIHFHGGLVNYDAGLTVANNLRPAYQAGRAYPIFFVWESGLGEVLINNIQEKLNQVASERLFRLIWKKISTIVARKVKKSSQDRSAQLPPVDTLELENSIIEALDQEDLNLLKEGDINVEDISVELDNNEQQNLEAELKVDAELTPEIQRVANGVYLSEDGNVARTAGAMGASETLIDDKAVEQLIDQPEAGTRGLLSTAKVIKAVVTIAAKVISRFIMKRHHGLHATIVEEILRYLYVANVGGKIWTIMKRDTADAFGDDAGVYGGTTLLSELADQGDPANLPRITLVGHSTGAIYIANFLEKASEIIPLAKFDVVFLAPAATFENSAAMISNHGRRIRNFRMFTMTDHYEKEDRLVPVLYPHSLLYFISGVLEGSHDVPIVGMERFYDGNQFPDNDFAAVKTVRDFVNSDNARAVWSVISDGPAGEKSESESHGDFDNDNATIESIQHILQNGF